MKKYNATIEFVEGFNIDCSQCIFFRNDKLCESSCSIEKAKTGKYLITKYEEVE